MVRLPDEKLRAAVRENYGAVARDKSSGCGPSTGSGASCCGAAPSEASSCCGPAPSGAGDLSRNAGYGDSEITSVPTDSNMGLGCGNPTAIASLRPGDTVLDLGSGGGFDCFLASAKVGRIGRVIGVDMTAEMVALARKNAVEGGYANVDFRLGEIEHLPLADNCVDVILSNCVINLSPDKAAVFGDAFRVLKPGGRLCVSDIVALAPMPDAIASDEKMVSGCIGGAAEVDEIVAWLGDSGFQDVRIEVNENSRQLIDGWGVGPETQGLVASATITGRKPAEKPT
ncbi:MAG: arsenite methyltransferase [Rhodospirillales bacterium]|nr:arsenite methyltransferase [Rhodospirillales bacterium]